MNELLLLSLAAFGPSDLVEVGLSSRLVGYAQQRLKAPTAIDAERSRSFDRLAAWIRARLEAGEPARLVFICTHNSRRSHIAQLWALAASRLHGVQGIETYSAGTEVTAFNPRAVAALRRSGFEITVEDPEAANPDYRVRLGPDSKPVVAFSKSLDAPTNPSKDFAAVMTCTAADAACPFVEGASLRVAVPYEDPKVSDGTPEEAAAYDARVAQIATEMLELFARVRRSSHPNP